MKRLNLDDPKVWDVWREIYYDLTPEENIQFGNDIFARYPGQASFNPEVFALAMQEHVKKEQTRPRVLEVGGWRGELAKHCFEKFFIGSWHNVDMCKAAVDNSLLMPHPYTSKFPYFFDWFTAPRTEIYDIFISCHTIEHLTNTHLFQLLDHVKGIPVIALEAPITMSGQTWGGYVGTHILEFGWDQINGIMETHGYSVKKVSDWVFIYTNGATNGG